MTKGRVLTATVGIAGLLWLVSFKTPSHHVLAQGSVTQGFADIAHPLKGGEEPGAIPEKGGQEQYGVYEPVADWPKPLTALPGHEKWTWGSPEGIFA
jgi:hypothetical protein